MRTKDPEGKVGEVPVTEKTVYRPPRRLTTESVEGATIGTEEIQTPAGTFTARRVEYQGAAGGGATTWFLSENVPGNVVRYQATRGGNQYTSSLLDYGRDATTQLDSYQLRTSHFEPAAAHLGRVLRNWFCYQVVDGTQGV